MKTRMVLCGAISRPGCDGRTRRPQRRSRSGDAQRLLVDRPDGTTVGRLARTLVPRPGRPIAVRRGRRPRASPPDTRRPHGDDWRRPSSGRSRPCRGTTRTAHDRPRWRHVSRVYRGGASRGLDARDHRYEILDAGTSRSWRACRPSAIRRSTEQPLCVSRAENVACGRRYGRRNPGVLIRATQDHAIFMKTPPVHDGLQAVCSRNIREPARSRCGRDASLPTSRRGYEIAAASRSAVAEFEAPPRYRARVRLCGRGTLAACLTSASLVTSTSVGTKRPAGKVVSTVRRTV